MNQHRNTNFRPSIVKFAAPDKDDTANSFSSTYTSSSNDESESEEKPCVTIKGKNDRKAKDDIQSSLNKLDLLNNMAYLKIQGDQNLKRGARPREYKNAMDKRKSMSIHSIIQQ